MNQNTATWKKLAASIFFCGLAATTHAQSSDALLNKLVSKGILTAEEAKDLSKEPGSKSPGDALAAKVSIADWITNLKLYGDFRGRFEQNDADSPLYHTRDRYRYRLRIGMNMTMLDNFDFGFRLASGNPQFNPGGTLVGGQPITATQDFNSLESHKFIWIDAAFARWTPIKNSDWTVSAMIGKMDNPFLLSNMIYDYDITPEGAAVQVAYNLAEHQTIRAIGGIFVLDELNQGAPTGSTTNAAPLVRASQDPYVYGGQLVLDSKWTPKLDTQLGLAMFNIANKDSLSAQVQPFYNSGNTRDANGFLLYNLNPIVASAWVTYKLDSFPLYTGAFPIKVGGEVMDNPGAPANNKGFRVGTTLGKAGKKRTWELNYRYQRLEADAWFDALVDEDNGAFYAPGNPQMVGTGKASGWFGGTNIKGHQIVAVYSFTDFLNFTFIYYRNELIINNPTEKSDAGHFMCDLNWKF